MSCNCKFQRNLSESQMEKNSKRSLPCIKMHNVVKSIIFYFNSSYTSRKSGKIGCDKMLLMLVVLWHISARKKYVSFVSSWYLKFLFRCPFCRGKRWTRGMLGIFCMAHANCRSWTVLGRFFLFAVGAVLQHGAFSPLVLCCRGMPSILHEGHLWNVWLLEVF